MMELPLPPPPPINSFDDEYSLEEDGITYGVNESQGQGTGEGQRVIYDPDFGDVASSLRWAFWLHSYGFGCLFFFLSFYSFFSILNLRSQLSSRPYMTTINSFLCLLGGCRSAVLFIDPYGLQHRLPPLINSLLWDLGFPSLISSFSLVQIAFIQLTQFVPHHTFCQKLSPKAPPIFYVTSSWAQIPPLAPTGDSAGSDSSRKKTCLSLVITLHFMSVIISAIYSSLNSDLMIGKMVTQLLFGTWGFLLCGSFLVAGKRVLQLLGSGGSSSSPATSGNEKGIANLFGMGMFGGGGGGQNLASSLTAALAPTLLQGSAAATEGSAAVASSSNTPKIKITDEHDRTYSSSESSRLNDIPEEGNGNGGQFPPITSSPRSSFSAQGQGQNQDPEPCSSHNVRPPSPVMPRRKSSGTGRLAATGGQGPRRLSWNARKDSGTGEMLGMTSLEARKKSLTWGEESVERVSAATEKRRASAASRKSFDATAISAPEGGVTESLLSSSVAEGPDYTLQSILSHIAYVNQTALDYRLNRKLSRTNQVHKVIKFTSVTAGFGFLICVGELIRLLSPFGLLASTTPLPPRSVWPWFLLQTSTRIFEFLMGAMLANITKQPVSRPHHYAAYSIRHKHVPHHRESLYL